MYSAHCMSCFSLLFSWKLVEGLELPLVDVVFFLISCSFLLFSTLPLTSMYTHWSVSLHDCVSRWSWWVSVWSVCFDWREACLPSWCSRKARCARIPEVRAGSNPVEGNGHFFPHTVSSIFCLSLTHIFIIIITPPPPVLSLSLYLCLSSLQSSLSSSPLLIRFTSSLYPPHTFPLSLRWRFLFFPTLPVKPCVFHTASTTFLLHLSPTIPFSFWSPSLLTHRSSPIALLLLTATSTQSRGRRKRSISFYVTLKRLGDL